MPANAAVFVWLLLAVVPGYIALAVWARYRTWRGPAGDLSTILRSLAASACIQLVAAPLTIVWLLPDRENLADHPLRIAVWGTVVVLVLPVLGGLLASKATERLPLGTSRPSVWDWLFTENPPHGRFLVVEFNDGTRVAGVFAQGAEAMTSPDKHGIYIVPEWVLDEDGEFDRELEGSAGLMILDLTDVRWVRVLKSEDEHA